MIQDKNSMLYWYPKIKDLPIPKPETLWIEVNAKDILDFIDGDILANYDEIEKVARQIGYPLFLRTDQLSGKHDWKNTCFVESEQALIKHLHAVSEETLGCDIIGRLVNAFFFREYIPMKNLFTAFWGEMPVNPEIRFFIEGGDVKCWHWYWIEEAIENPSIPNWREVLQKEKASITETELSWLHIYARHTAHAFVNEGFWSVDFCKGGDGTWYLIDMAMGENSWHPKDCKFNKTETIDFLKRDEKRNEQAP